MEFSTTLINPPDASNYTSSIISQISYYYHYIVKTTTIDQVLLGIFGVTAIRLSQDHREAVRKWACIFGLLGQPFWLYATFSKELWVMFLICVLYTFAWFKGFKQWWLVKNTKLIINVDKINTH